MAPAGTRPHSCRPCRHMMKLAAALLSAVLVLAATVRADESTTPANLDAVAALRKCATDRGLTRDVLKSACEGNLPADLEAYKCYTQCVQQEVGMMDKTGKIDPVRAAKSLVDPKQQERMKDIATKCPGDDTPNLCAKAFSVDRCYVKEDTEMYTRNCNTLVQMLS